MIGRRLAFKILLCCAVIAPQRANACAVSTRGFDPDYFVADAIVRAKLTNIEGVNTAPDYTFKVRRVILGKVAQRTLSISSVKLAVCMFIPTSGNVGDDLILYLERTSSGFSIRGLDKRKLSDQEIIENNNLARRRTQRRKTFFAVDSLSRPRRGSLPAALSYNDPRSWFSPVDLPPILFTSPSSAVVVRFQLDTNGSVISCEAQTRVGKVDDLAEKRRVCALLKARADFVPPEFPEEHNGILFLSVRGVEPQ